MRELGAVVFTIAFVIFAWSMANVANANENNNVMKACLYKNGYSVDNFDTFNFNLAAACYHNYKTEANAVKLAELRDFLKHNPRYRYPGQSNNRCWGKPREMPFESAYIEQTTNGFKAGVSYKDKLPAGCYESAPWDNRND